ncbi:hypothetical protein [Microlunatus sp. Gsoil 973]|uniref:hypothetical protein n=1 Tax=Microlunatus sp. Gsoil 973 TaxID=2672569 RepID=UPI0012B4D7AD|nr:hypothetical protein [Microlunatus sp. Gsoil 973]QGN34801.1 hypothetical protein GJV80_20460 [Microlunatus sp. Gsoil 973]
MNLPDYWLARPPGPDQQTAVEFDQLLDAVAENDACELIDYRLTAPKWQFLCHAAGSGFVMHGTGRADIEIFEPRQPDDPSEFGGRRGVFAAEDGIWPMYFAIVDRDRYPMGLLNACILVGPDAEARYFFSITDSVLPHRPWRSGVVYLLPAAGFDSQPPATVDGKEVRLAQAVNPDPVRPLAKLRIEPEDFPFLQQIRGHDHDVIRARFEADPDGFPWLEPARSDQG